jgi:hypothetical protein
MRELVEIRLQRTHITEEAAHTAVLNDFVAFKKAFPDVIVKANPNTVRLGEVRYPEKIPRKSGIWRICRARTLC